MMMTNPKTGPTDPSRVQIGRRSVLLGSVAAAGLTAIGPGAAWADAEPAAIHLLPHRTGSGLGASWSDAAPFDRAGVLAASLDSGQSILFGTTDAFPDPLPWSGQQAAIDAGGTPDAPIVIQFGRVNSDGEFNQPDAPDAPPQLQMVGRETAPGERPDVGGAPFLVLGPHASHLDISGPVFDRAGGNGFFNLDADGVLRDLQFSDIHARNVGRVIETERGTAVEGLLVERCSVRGAIRGFARFHTLTGAEFRDLDLDADFVDGGGGAVCQLISVVAGEDLNFSNIRLARAVNTLAAEERGSTYIQGDGLVLEEETHNVRIMGCHAEDMGDGGFDLKSEGVHMIDCTATRCKLGIRIWSHHPDNLIERCRVTEPVTRPYNEGSCLWLGGVLTVRECKFHATDDMSPIRFGGGNDGGREPMLKIEGGVITHSEGVPLTTGVAGDVELENVLVNGEETSGHFYWTGRRLRRRWL